VVPSEPTAVPSKPIRVLLIDDDRLVSDFIGKIFARLSPETVVESYTDSRDGLTRAKATDFDVVVTDLMMPMVTGLDIMRELHEAKPKLPVILMTGYGNPDVAMEAGRLGVHEFLNKPFTPEQLIDAVESAAEIHRLANEPVALEPNRKSGRLLVGNSRVIKDLSIQIGKVAASSLPVLIEGPTGSGKELVARALYQYSGRSGKPFLAVSCTEMPEALLESELFGYESGALPGIDRGRAGKFEQAEGGTIFLDEIGEMTLSTQAKLLRVLQEQEIQRLGSQQHVAVDVRILASSHVDLEQAVRDKRFREDLFFRLRGVKITVPSLAERVDDIPLLVDYFISRHARNIGFPKASITPEAISALQEISWPGNVRQLENLVCELILRAREHPINRSHVESTTGTDLGESTQDARFATLVAQTLRRAQSGEIPSALPKLMDLVEREIYGQAYALTQGNRSRMSRLLGVSRPTVLDKIAQYGLGSSNKG
jgi:DNA-binding NtrC family response regulator